MAPPVFDHDLCLLQCVEDFSVEQFIAQFAVEALAIAVLPRTSGFDVSRPGSDGRYPLAKSQGDELRAIVGANVRRNAPRDKQVAERFNDIGRLELPRDTDGQTFAAELVDDADLPPLKWSSLKYDFDEEDKINGKEAAYS